MPGNFLFEGFPKDRDRQDACPTLFFKMFIALGGQRARARFVAKRDAFPGGDFADTGQREFGKLLFPRIQQRYGVLAGDGKKQFEILTIGERVRISGGSPLGPGRQSRTPQAQLATGFGPPLTSTRHIRQLPAIESRS